eukprot:COSAG02_NODE_240_length_27672_cov_67.291445_29_plen_133_part_00
MCHDRLQHHATRLVVAALVQIARTVVLHPLRHDRLRCNVTGGLNIFCGILGTLMSFLKYAEVYEAHCIAAVSWSSLGRNIQIELALKAERRNNCRDFLKVSRAEYDRLLESSPGIDQDIIVLFNKRFHCILS